MSASAPEIPGLAAPGSLRRLFTPIRGHLALCAILSALSAAAGIVPYIAVAEIARVMLENPAGAASTVWTWVAVGAAGAGLWLLLAVQSARVGHFADASLLHDLRRRIVRHLGSLPLGWFRAAGSGKVKRAMTGDLEEMHEVIAHALGQLTGAVTVIAVGAAYLFAVDARMTLIALAVLALMALFYRIAMRSMTTHMNRLIAAEARISAASIEYADGIQVVKTFGTGGRVLRRFDEAVDEHTRAFADWVAEVQYSSAMSRLFGSEMAVLAAVAATGLAFVADGTLGVADLVAFLVVAVGLPTSILPAVSAAQGVRKGRMGAANIERLLSRAPLPEPSLASTPTGHEVEFDRVTFSYDGVTNAVEDVSAVCPPGSVTALVGPSGAGKTTLASLLPRFYDVTDGAVRVGGVDVRSIPSTELLSSMSLVFQDVALLRDSVAENIRIGRPGASDDEVRAAATAAHIHDVIELLPQGYDTPLDGGGGSLSGGERQRLTIARAILSGAPVVVLDEATAALDPDSEAAVQDALAGLADGKTVIVIAHRLHTIVGADQILVLDGGRLVERGSHDDLLAHGGLYARMWAAQEGVPA
ncbi:ABC transporter ATP-binding protein [Micromonospora craniellae]|uniref:ABC transporter ATP-binding protein n=1 Tax=Micromonospora craniellae TaxID=2294034 RepID=A0A372G4L3_9ACTN|nr:ABC transporter ATP-binding protein [Micromonospora craniellae]QOC90677.1 ABC transporter ATP-binding protein [Micromonospora craniellae]RFS47945.1 ABC transporter ATP-binding protein [Micromonospora craniellae]